jgi:hypothetical protein
MTARHGIDGVRTAVAGLCRAWGRAGSELPQTADAAPGRSPGIGFHSATHAVAVIAARTQLPGLRAPALFLSVAAAAPCSPGAAAGGRRAALPPSVRRPSSFRFRRKPEVASGVESRHAFEDRPRLTRSRSNLSLRRKRGETATILSHSGGHQLTACGVPDSRSSARPRHQSLHQPLDDDPDGLRVRLSAHRRPLPIRDARTVPPRTLRSVARKHPAPIVSLRHERRSDRWTESVLQRYD